MEKSMNIKYDVLDVVKAVLISLLISLALVLIFALIVRYASVDNSVILPVNIAIKFAALFLGILFGFRQPQNGILKGAVSGLMFMLLSFLIFAALDAFKDVKFSWIDMLTLTVGGAVCGIIAVNIKRKSRPRGKSRDAAPA
jgi:putative membrane protein (TIGR04086 family)